MWLVIKLIDYDSCRYVFSPRLCHWEFREDLSSSKDWGDYGLMDVVTDWIIGKWIARFTAYDHDHYRGLAIKLW